MLNKRKKWSSAEKEELWTKYRSGDISVSKELLEAYVPLVEIIATKAAARLKNSVELGDLISDGFIGLVDAVEKFDHTKGFKFETYATGRIWGEIYDRLREYDWVSRYSRLKFKQLTRTTDILSERLQRTPSVEEIAEEAGWDVEEVHKVNSLFYGSISVNIDDFASDESEGFSLQEVIPDNSIGEPDYVSNEADIMEKLSIAMNSLSSQESVIMYLYHYEQESFADIAESLGIGPSRVSQVYNEGLRHLQDVFV